MAKKTNTKADEAATGQEPAAGENQPPVSPPTTDPAVGSGSKQVRVICDGFLGTQALTAGDVTDDAEYVELLGTEWGKGLVEAVK